MRPQIPTAPASTHADRARRAPVIGPSWGRRRLSQLPIISHAASPQPNEREQCRETGEEGALLRTSYVKRSGNRQCPAAPGPRPPIRIGSLARSPLGLDLCPARGPPRTCATPVINATVRGYSARPIPPFRPPATPVSRTCLPRPGEGEGRRPTTSSPRPVRESQTNGLAFCLLVSDLNRCHPAARMTPSLAFMLISGGRSGGNGGVKPP